MSHWWEEHDIEDPEFFLRTMPFLVPADLRLGEREPVRKTGKSLRVRQGKHEVVWIFRIRSGREPVTPHQEYMRALDGLRDGFSARLGAGPVTGRVVFK